MVNFTSVSLSSIKSGLQLDLKRYLRHKKEVPLRTFKSVNIKIRTKILGFETQLPIRSIKIIPSITDINI